jgi:hypothetical protein
MNEQDQKNLLSSIGVYVRREIAAATDPLRRRIAELESTQGEFRYCGVWGGGPYKRGNFITHQGSLWHCNLDTENKPGKDPAAWTLCVKRGKDGFDGADGR